jgi:hypothetical protein
MLQALLYQILRSGHQEPTNDYYPHENPSRSRLESGFSADH